MELHTIEHRGTNYYVVLPDYCKVEKLQPLTILSYLFIIEIQLCKTQSYV